MKKCFIIFCSIFLFSGCVTRVGDFTVASSKNMDITKSTHRVDESERLVGIDRKHIIILVPTGTPNMKEAMDQAIEQRKGAVALSNVTVKAKQWYIPYIYGRIEYEVEGNPIYENK